MKAIHGRKCMKVSSIYNPIATQCHAITLVARQVIQVLQLLRDPRHRHASVRGSKWQQVIAHVPPSGFCTPLPHCFLTLSLDVKSPKIKSSSEVTPTVLPLESAWNHGKTWKSYQINGDIYDSPTKYCVCAKAPLFEPQKHPWHCWPVD